MDENNTGRDAEQLVRMTMFEYNFPKFTFQTLKDGVSDPASEKKAEPFIYVRRIYTHHFWRE